MQQKSAGTYLGIASTVSSPDGREVRLHEFLQANRGELIERCRAKVALRTAPRPTEAEMEHGIPLFLGQLIETLRTELPGQDRPPSTSTAPSQMASSAAKHGRELLRHGFTVDQVVHDYGDLCQAATELALERKTPVSVAEFRTLNRCLDDAIAEAVHEFGWQRDKVISENSDRETNERLGFLAHELRNFLNTAMLSFAAIKRGGVGIDGATSAVLDRSFLGIRGLVDRALADVRLSAGTNLRLVEVDLGEFLADVQVAASLEAKGRGCGFGVLPLEPGLLVRVDRELLYSALSNLLQNAFKFTRPHTHVALSARADGDRVLIEVEDQCGGIPRGIAAKLFDPFEQAHADRSGLGLGLSIAQRAVKALEGRISVRDKPGMGCVFTIDLPRPVQS
jgi:signal transduction histidine kinase